MKISRKDPLQERYFVETYSQIYEVEQIIKKDEETKIFQVVVKNASDIKRLTWTLLNLDINFTRKPLGSGISIFFIDTSVPYFLKKKGKE